MTYHTALADAAEELWVRHMAKCEDNGVDADSGAAVLATAAAMCAAFVFGCGATSNNRPLDEQFVREVINDFELTFLKRLEGSYGATISDEVRRRVASLDRMVKRRRGLPTEPGGEA